MYKSPIEVIFDKQNTIIEDEIMKAVTKVGIIVDKDELLKALNNDRDQYNKGFEAGWNAFADYISTIIATKRADENGL